MSYSHFNKATKEKGKPLTKEPVAFRVAYVCMHTCVAVQTKWWESKKNERKKELSFSFILSMPLLIKPTNNSTLLMRFHPLTPINGLPPLLCWFQFGPKLLEVLHECLHAWERVGEVLLPQLEDGLLYPLQQLCGQGIVVLLLGLDVHHDTYHLTG